MAIPARNLSIETPIVSTTEAPHDRKAEETLLDNTVLSESPPLQLTTEEPKEERNIEPTIEETAAGARKLIRKSRLEAITEATLLEQNTYIEKVALTVENLHAFWFQFLETHKKIINPSYYGTFTELEPQFIDSQNIEFTVISSVIKGSLDSIRVDMHSYFKKYLSHPLTITIRVEITEEDRQSKPRTPMERYIDLAEKNPALKTLIDKLNLDLDI